MLKERPHFPQRQYVSSPALAHSCEKTDNMRPAFHNHPAQCKAGPGVIIFPGITGVLAVQRTTAAPATVAAPQSHSPPDHSLNRQKLYFHKALIVKTCTCERTSLHQTERVC